MRGPLSKALALGLLAPLLPAALGAADAVETLRSWDFTRGLEGWDPNFDVANVRTTASGIEFDSTGIDPWLPARLAVQATIAAAEKGAAVDFLSEAMFYSTGGLYYIPFRSLYSRTIANLMMAGRCFSCSHIGLAGPRVMKTCGQMGIATGYAAALCKKHGATPREVGRQHIGELRRLIGYEPVST